VCILGVLARRVGGALVTEEKTALEPTIVSQKYYVQGIGQVFESDIKGSTEYARLLSITKK
jgi:hypothetical protein